MYNKAIDGMHAELLQVSTPSGLSYIANKNEGNIDHKMDHLVYFMGTDWTMNVLNLIYVPARH
jgi:mannosyl-oligosaccharide alpha-1,2-mannosidase